MSVTFYAIPRDEVVRYLGPSWPAPAGSPLLRLPEGSDITSGAVIVQGAAGQPGVTWWLVDGVVPTQAAGVVDEVLAEQVPGAVLETVPEPWQSPTPPTTYDPS